MTKSVAPPSFRNTRPKRRSDSNVIGIWIVGISAAIVLAVVLIIAFSNRPAATAIQAPDVPAEWLNGTTMGDPNAPLTVQMWEDFLCPHCRSWTTDLEPRLIEEYVKPGHVKIVFHHFPLSGFQPGSGMAAMASLCAADQNGFWPYHDRLFLAQDQGQAGYQINELVRYADEVGIDSRALLECMSSQTHRTTIDESLRQANALQLTGTPTIIVGDTRIANYADWNEVSSAVEAELAELGVQ